MATLREVYEVACFDCMEDDGLVLGILTDAQYLAIANEVILDFLTQTCLIKRLNTQTVYGGTSVYTVPDDILRVDHVWWAGRYLERSTVSDLQNTLRNWRNSTGIPKVFHEDGLALKQVEIVPTPNFNGSFIPGASEPSAPHDQYDTFYCTVRTDAGTSVQSPAQHRGLTVCGPRAPTVLTALDDPIPLIPDEFALGYLGFGILARIFGGDNELKDTQKAAFCQSNYQEGVNLAKAISGEVLEGEIS